MKRGVSAQVLRGRGCAALQEGLESGVRSPFVFTRDARGGEGSLFRPVFRVSGRPLTEQEPDHVRQDGCPLYGERLSCNARSRMSEQTTCLGSPLPGVQGRADPGNHILQMARPELHIPEPVSLRSPAVLELLAALQAKGDLYPRLQLV